MFRVQGLIRVQGLGFKCMFCRIMCEKRISFCSPRFFSSRPRPKPTGKGVKAQAQGLGFWLEDFRVLILDVTLNPKPTTLYALNL